MSVLSSPRTDVSIGRRPGPALVAGLLIAAAAVSLQHHAVNAIGGGLLAGAAVTAIVVGVRPTLRALARRRSLWLLVLAGGLLLAWGISGYVRLHDGAQGYVPASHGQLLSAFSFDRSLFPGLGWPWRVGRTLIVIPLLSLAAAAGGLVLITDAVRLQLGLPGLTASGWRLLTAARPGPARVLSRALPGVALILFAAGLSVTNVTTYVGEDPLARAVLVMLIGVWAVALIAAPPLVGVWLILDRDKAGRAREQERLRFAAHLHDSVLQTLALIQRQSADPAAVTRLARRQEHALRAWMAGQTDLSSATLGAALREVIAEVEDERGLTVEVSLLGDRGLDPAGEALVAAVREALRNAAAHAPGASVTVFAQIEAGATEVFVRDAGPGFAIEAVPGERRGIRDAIIGRMSSVGAQAIVESTPGEGTEVILRLS